MKSKVTFGKWESHLAIGGEYYIVVKNQFGHGYDRLATVDGNLPDAEANAALIAAAPEMLDALKTVRALALPGATHIHQVTEAAIAKAEGRS